MKEALLELRGEYKKKFTAFYEAAEILETIAPDLFKECIKKAAGCKLMIDEYDRQLSDLKS